MNSVGLVLCIAGISLHVCLKASQGEAPSETDGNAAQNSDTYKLLSNAPFVSGSDTEEEEEILDT